MKFIRTLLRKPSLNDILEFAIEKGACLGNLNAFKKALEQKDDLVAWQIVLGNYSWLKYMGLKLSLKYAQEKAQNVGRKCFRSDYYIFDVKNGERVSKAKNYDYEENFLGFDDFD